MKGKRQRQTIRLPVQQGVAIVTVLLLVAVLVVMATRMTSQFQYQVLKAHGQLSVEQAYWHGLGAEALAQVALKQLHESSPERTHLAQSWAEEQGPFPIRGGYMAGQVHDLQACFNLNALYKDQQRLDRFEQAKGQYYHLLLALQVDEYVAESLVFTLADWLDDDQQLDHNLGAEDPDYEALPIGYQATNALLVHVSELRQVKGYTQEIYQLLKDFVCVIPGNSRWELNINTVSVDKPELLVAFFQGAIDLTAAGSMLESRPLDGFTSPQMVLEMPELQSGDTKNKIQGAVNSLRVVSYYFELYSQVIHGDLEWRGYAQLHRDGDKVRVIYRSRQGYE